MCIWNTLFKNIGFALLFEKQTRLGKMQKLPVITTFTASVI